MTKVHFLNEIKEGTLSREEIAEKYDLKRSTLATYIQNEATIVTACKEQHSANWRRK